MTICAIHRYQQLQTYFEVSEQIPTKIWLFSDTDQQLSAGALVQ